MFSEFEAIEIIIKIIELLEFLHEKNIIHTNLNPSNIFLKKSQTKNMCFLNLYHCSWKPQDILHNIKLGPEYDDNISIFDTRTRNNNYISPEQIEIGKELAHIVSKKNGKIDMNSYDIQEFLLIKKYEKP